MADMMSGVSGAGGGDMMRLVGMASGLDVDGTVKKMLMGDQKKVDIAKQQREALVWKQESYREIVKETKALQDKYFNATSKDSLLNSKNYSDYNVNSTNEAVATAIGKAGAVEGSYKIDVKQMAKGARVESGKLQILNKNVKLSNTLKDLGITIDPSQNGIEIKINGDEVEVKATNVTKDEKNKFTLNEDMKISEFINKMNIASEGKVKARYSELTGKLSIETSKTGEDAKLNLNGIPNQLKLGTPINGQNAEVIITEAGGEQIKETHEEYESGKKINKPGIKITQSSNNFTIDGVNYNLKGEGKSTLSVSQDADKTFDRIKGFIDDYNALVGSITKKLTERKQYSYKPLTENQKKGMKDSEIKAWEEKAKQGILRNDPNLERMLRELRGTFFDEVSGAGITFGRNDLGLDTTNEVATAGQIKFTPGGEEKLKKALKEKPDEVMKLFNQTPTSTISGTDIEKKKHEYKNSGILQRMNSILKDYVGVAGTTLNTAILTKYANKQEDFTYAGTGGNNNIPDQIYRKDKMIKDLMSKMRVREEQLYKQFSKLETVMNRYNAQAGWLSQQFGG